MEVISRGGSTAQIDPKNFCRWMLREVEGRGVSVRFPARVLRVLQDADGVLCGVSLWQDGVETECKSASYF